MFGLSNLRTTRPIGGSLVEPGARVFAPGATAAASEERRRYPRYEVNLLAEVRDSAGAVRRGRVRDLCLGGALLAGFDEGWMGELRPGAPLELRFDLSASFGIATVPVRATVARVIECGLGVQFEASEGPALDSLRRFIDRVLTRSRAASVGAKGHEGVPKADRARAAAILKRVSTQRGETLLNAWIEAAADALWRAIDRATDGGDKQHLIDDSTRLGQARAASGAASLRARLQDDGDEVALRHSETTESSSELALVDTEGFETWLEASALVSRLEDELAEPLAIVQAQLDHALGSAVRMQLVPKRLAESFDGWTEAQGLSPVGRRVALRSGRKVLPRLLAAYYRDLSRALEEAGFPRVKRHAVRVPVNPGGTVGPGQGPEPQAKETGAAPAARVGKGRLTSARVAELLAALPAEALKSGAGEPQGSLREQALRLLAELDPGLGDQPLSPAVEERMEVADRVVGRIADHQAVTPRSAQWASQLGLHILTAAVADPEFFRPPGHPLLQLLERLDHLALFLPADPDIKNDEVVQEVDGLVQRARERDARDREGFRPLIDSVIALERRRGERYRRDATRAICQLEGRDRRRAAHNSVQVGLERRFAGRPLHRVVAEVIDAAWGTLLQLRYLREGEGGAQLARAWQVLEALADLCGGDSDAAGTDIETLVPELAAGLAYVGFDPFLAEDLVQRVQEAARLARAGLLGDDDCPIYQPPPEPKSPAEVALGELDPEVIADLGGQVDALGPGGVLHLRDAGGERLLRLIWASPDQVEYAFLGGHDGELRSFSREALLMGLNSGDMAVRTPTGVALGERALDATLREMQQRLRYHETRDGLTGLYNPHHLSGRLAELLTGPAAERHVLGFLDIDHFHAISTTCGYGAGEQLLKAVARLMTQRLGASATLAFLGGHRFGLLLPSVEPAAGLAMCEQLCCDVYGLRFEWQGKAYPVTGSIGAVIARPGEGDPDGLLSAVGVAVTTAQENGGNRLQVFSEDDEGIRQSRERLRWLAIAEEVIKAERIRLRVQMIAPVDPESGRGTHHEVLMRALDAQGEELDLGRFIATAEAFNLMGQVDRIVLSKAIAWAGENPALLSRLGGIAINLSGVSLSDASLPGFIRARLEASGVAPSRVSFEVTETAAIANLKRAAGVIRAIRDIGCRVALDDFGAGMSSYSYLKSLPVDFVKIDGCFVRDLLNNAHDLAIVKSMNEIAHFMGIQTIAEYAEHPGVIERLAEIGVDFVQGFAVRKPLFLDEVSADY
jgi:diguanylate cyclase (GGDEF)-like protein